MTISCICRLCAIVVDDLSMQSLLFGMAVIAQNLFSAQNCRFLWQIAEKRLR